MTADEKIAAWAAKRLGIDAADIQEVKFVQEDGFWMSEWTYQPGYQGANVRCIGSLTRHISLDGEDFFDIVREILEAAGIRP